MSTPQSERPLSPHLQIYKPQISSVLSITHRMTGIALSLGSLLLVGWLWAVAYDGEYFADWQQMASHPVSKVLLMGWTFALYYHLCNGIRHLFWDTGRGFDLKNMTVSGIIVVLIALTATVGTWCMILQKVSFLQGA